MPLRLTKSGYERLRRELEQLYQRRAQLIEEVRETGAEGDLSENAGLDAAKRSLGLVEARIKHLERQLVDAEIIEQNGQPEHVDVGVIVTLEDLDTGDLLRLRIAEAIEADLSSPVKTATPNSPLGLALRGKKVGDEVTVTLKTKTQRFRVVDLTWDGSESEPQQLTG
ncbi:GreA/GreB family elongation factor [Fervidibacter sacchari]|uniref:Transcription elongation factor GreA n=2 Tax=Candidatus Fervidibacter sacchari TaxID=1448929 RepID=A0ABT2EQW4_9BACT|nr:GreA/GreB family elongation factor [Candidatus Fervidibacter sacchari]MCS3920344.1 transcription elongation factor GreA [Candidatus Fervidibacter sacchari]WKU14696.1 GreA/GreB family elongation factor [Candidatus Fervidibacter sacchari]